MKKSVLKLYITLVFLFTNIMVFADPGDESDGGDLEGGEPMPINSKLVVLALFGVLFAFYVFNRNRKKRIA